MKEFEKLNRIGEGTYGIVCEWLQWQAWDPGTVLAAAVSGLEGECR